MRKDFEETNEDNMIIPVGAQIMFKHLVCVGISHLKQRWPNCMINGEGEGVHQFTEDGNMMKMKMEKFNGYLTLVSTVQGKHENVEVL